MRVPLVLLLGLCLVSSYKILVYNSRFAHSHSNFMGRVADLLVDAGHNVTSLIPIMEDTIKDGTKKSAIIHVPTSEIAKDYYDKNMRVSVNFFETRTMDLVFNLIVGRMLGYTFSEQCKATLNHPGLLERLKAEHYDVVLYENFDMCGAGIAHLIDPKSTILVSTSVFWGEHYDELGIPVFNSFNPSSFTTKIDVHSPISRAWNSFAEWLIRNFFGDIRKAIHGVFTETYGSNFPSWVDITSKVAYAFANAEPLIDFAHPTLHRVIDIGGIGAEAPKQLDEYWNGILALRQKTVLLSFGSMVLSKTMPPPSRAALLKMIAAFPDVTFIWKYEELEDEWAKNEASQLKNLILHSWTPQNDLLNDPRLSLFITHGGMGSTQETAMRGVPGIYIPMMGDQPRNAAMMEHNGLGKVLCKTELSNAEKLISTVKEVLTNEIYRTNAQRISKMLAKKPFTSKELLIKHVEFAAEFGPSPSLRPQSVDMSFIAYHNLDIILAALLFLAVSATIATAILIYCLRKYFPPNKTKKE